MSEPVYDEDLVNLGYLKRIVEEFEENSLPDNISRNYGSRPNPPYYKGDTWIDGSTVYTCINTRAIGLYTDSDWVTESGAKAEAESKNKTYLEQPSNYSVGDMWILQTDNDHKAGKKGDVLIATVGRQTYNENDWVSMLGYGDIASINEILGNIDEAVKELGLEKENGVLTISYDNTVPELNENDLWYVTADNDVYTKGELYKYSNDTFSPILDKNIINAIGEASQSNITADGKLQIFYEDRLNISTMSRGDLCTENKILYRYNGTNWVEVYSTKTKETIEELNTITERIVSINTDLGEINQTVSQTTENLENITEEVSSIKQTQNKWNATFKKMGGNNLIKYKLDSWDSYSGAIEYTDTDIKNNSTSGIGYLISAGVSKQLIKVENGEYTISFKYKVTGSSSGTGYILINDDRIDLEETEWTKVEKTIRVETNEIKIEIGANINNYMCIVDLMCNSGIIAEIWTQNPNEIITDTVTIGKGIQVESSVMNTYTRIDADGNRTYNKSTNETVSEITDKGTKTKELVVKEDATINRLFVTQVGNQIWLTGIGG